jgi:aerotaxis receptor
MLMRNNQPVSQVEIVVPENGYIYSRTDTKGFIQSYNEMFKQMSGYSDEELLGAPHNLVRHPDMPVEAFEDLWRDLQAGVPWTGLVKNRSKDGRYYWVRAQASPVRENGKVVGYESVRRRASKAECDATDAIYKLFREGRAQRLRILHGKVVKTGWLAGLLRPTLLKSQYTGLGLLVLALALSNASLLLGSALPVAVNIAAAVLGVLGLGICLRSTQRTQSDIASLSDTIASTLRDGNLKRNAQLNRLDTLGEVAEQYNLLMANIQAIMHSGLATAELVQRRAAELTGSASRAADRRACKAMRRFRPLPQSRR